MHVPEIHEQRKKISGLKMPRQYTPRLPGASVKGQAPVNPFSGNKMKVASLSSFREAQLIKTASAEDAHLYYEMCKLADTGDELQIRMFLAQHPEMEKDAGIIGHGFRLLSKALGGAGKTFNSSRLTAAAGKASDAAAKRFSKAAVNPRNLGQAAKETQYASLAGASGKRGGELTSAAKNIREAKAVKSQVNAGQVTAPAAPAPAPSNVVSGAPSAFKGQSDDAVRAAAEGGDEAAKRALARRVSEKQLEAVAKIAPAGGAVAKTAPEAAASPLISNSTLGKAIVGTAAAGTLGAVGYGGYKGTQRGRQQNLQQQGRGFNYGM